MNPPPAERECGACTLCCTVLRVDEIGKLAGVDCIHQGEAGCGIYARRPAICRDYRCLWLRGGLRDDDRPDRLGAVVDVVARGAEPQLSIQEAQPGAFDASSRLREIAEHHRRSMPVRIVEAGNVLDADRPFRVLLPSGEEQRVNGERIALYRDGRKIGERRIPWIDRLVRRLQVRLRARALRRAASSAPPPA